MSISGTQAPLGTTTAQESIYVTSGPDVYFQDWRAPYTHNPDSNQMYWGLSGTATYPVYKVGCYEGLTWNPVDTMNDIMCDASGLGAVAQSRMGITGTFTLKSLFPLTILQHFLLGGPAVENTTDGAEYLPIGDIQRQQNYWHLMFTKVYDTDTADYIALYFHKVQFTTPGAMANAWATPWTVPVNFRGFADANLPSSQRFMTIVRYDSSVIV